MPPLKFRNIKIKLQDSGPHDIGLTWADVKIGLLDLEHGIGPMLKVAASIQYDESATVAQSCQRALDYTQHVLETALALLREHNLQELRRLETKFEAEEDARMDREMQESLSNFSLSKD